MSNDNVFERLWKLQAKANSLVLDSKRNPQVLIDFYQKFLETPEWKTWMTIKLGTGLKNADDFCKALRAGKNNISDWANGILGRHDFYFKLSGTEHDVELVNVSVEELGFKQGACYGDICKRASKLGLDLCPAEVGPQLRLQYKDQPKGTGVAVAMNAINDLDNNIRVFGVRCSNDGGLYLHANNGRSDYFWGSENRFVFIRRKVA